MEFEDSITEIVETIIISHLGEGSTLRECKELCLNHVLEGTCNKLGVQGKHVKFCDAYHLKDVVNDQC